MYFPKYLRLALLGCCATALPATQLTSRPAEVLHSSRSLAITTRTVWFKPANLERELVRSLEFKQLGMVVANDERKADLIVTIDRPVGTFVWTYSVRDRQSSVVLAVGQVESESGRDAAPRLAAEIVKSLRAKEAPSRSSAPPQISRPADALQSSRSVAITTRTEWFKPANLERELFRSPEFKQLGMVVANDERKADLIVTIDRPVATFIWTYSVRDRQSSVVLAVGQVESESGRDAAPLLAAEIVKLLKGSAEGRQ